MVWVVLESGGKLRVKPSMSRAVMIVDTPVQYRLVDSSIESRIQRQAGKQTVLYFLDGIGGWLMCIRHLRCCLDFSTR